MDKLWASIWTFIQDPNNRATLSWIGSGFMVIFGILAGLFWKSKNAGKNNALDPPSVKDLIKSTAKKARQYGIQEGQLIALARRYGSTAPENFAEALAGVENALKMAHRDLQRAQSNPVSGDAAAVIARVDNLNKAGQLDQAAEALKNAIDSELANQKNRQVRLLELYDKGITQAVFTRNPQDAARYALAKLDIAGPTSATDRFEALRLEQNAWVMRGQDKGLNFDLEVAILLARDLTHRAQDAAQHGVAFNALGIALAELGKRRLPRPGLRRRWTPTKRPLRFTHKKIFRQTGP